MVLAGIALGFVALLLLETMQACASVARRLPGPRWLIAAGGGALLALLAAAWSPRYLGLGLDTLEDAVRGVALPPEAFVLKIVFTAISLAVGGSGGIITSVFFIGAPAGSVVGGVLGSDRGLFATLGHDLAARGRGQRTDRRRGDGDRAVRPFDRSLRRAHRHRQLPDGRSPQRVRQPAAGVAKSASLVAPAEVELSSLTSLAMRRRVSRRRALFRALRRRLRRSEAADR